MASETAAKSAQEHGLKSVEIAVRSGSGRESAVVLLLPLVLK